MEKIILTLIFSCTLLAYNSSMFSNNCEVADNEPEKEEFWPADMIPHPHPPWSKPKKPSDGDLA